ncbi:hypothetical protein T459_03307 [Capsicum annuum]|uniref:Ubiquitin-like protease family profile domain-containing protein n=1 Tax=Capsicum annuum TaxID=4072 RepID=A0A2G3AMG6_CAPAN|nr:hypothetical protein FXO37_18739 [Capsicum annuum]PHT95425.1 hypothetical protein T459_03307 [Capsicum annuum]
MLDSMKYQVYKRKSMYRCGGFPLAFQCWFYECCPYANDKFVVRVGDSVLRLPVFEPVPQKEHSAFKKSDGSSDSSKEHMREDSPVNSQNELKLLRIDLNLLKDDVLSMKQLMTSSFDLIFKALDINKGSKWSYLGLKNNDTHAGNPIGVNLSDNVGRQTDGTPKVDHVSDNMVDGVGQKNIGVWDCIDVEARNKLSVNLVDDVEKENIDVGDHIDVVAGYHLSDNEIDDIGKETVGVGDRIDTDANDRPITSDESSTFLNFDFLKFKPSGNKIGEEEIDWSVVLDSESSKYTQPDKIGEHSMTEKAVGKIDTNLGSTSVALVATKVLVNVGSSRKNVNDTSVGDKSTVILDDTPVVPRRIRKPSAISESPYVSKFDSGCNNVQDKRKDVAVIKDDSEIVEYILGYVMRIDINLLCSIDFWDKRSDGITTADSFYIRMVDGLPTQKNTDCGIFVAAFAEYMIEGVQIPASLDDIDNLRSRYGVLLWQYGKIK